MLLVNSPLFPTSSPPLCASRLALSVSREGCSTSVPGVCLDPAGAVKSCRPQNKKAPLPFRETRPQFLLDLSLLLPMPAVAGFLVLFMGGGDSGAAHLVLVLGQDGADFLVDFVLDGNFFHHAVADFQDHRLDVFFFDGNLLVFDKLLDHLRGHVADIIAVQQHLWDVPLVDSKLLSLLAARSFRNRSRRGGRLENAGKNEKLSVSVTMRAASCSMEKCEQKAVSSVG